jgi:hypothetical protein
MGPYYCIIGGYHDNNRYPNTKYRHVKMGLPSREGAISAAHVRLAMAMCTMCDLWDGPMEEEAAETETERHEKDLAVAGGQDCHGARWSAFWKGHPPSATWVESIKWVLVGTER